MNQCSLVQQLQTFGQEITVCVETLNDVCLRFFSFINGHVFKTEEDWRETLSTFKRSVINCAGGIRTEKTALYQQIVQILLNPSKVVTGKCAIVHTMKQLLTQEDGQGSGNQCSVCQTSGGLIVRCSGQRCHKPVHVNCASKLLASKKLGASFYRCPSCSPSEISDDTTRKRGPSKGAGTGHRKKHNYTAKSKPAIQEKDFSSAPQAIVVAVAADSNCSSLKSPEARQSATSADAVTLLCSDIPGSEQSCKLRDHRDGGSSDEQTSGSFLTNHLDDASWQADPRAAADCAGTFCSDHDALSDACQELFFMRSDSENLRVALQAAHQTVSSNVSPPNAARVRTVLGQIRFGLHTLAHLVQQFQTAYQIPSMEFPPSFGGGVAASNDVLSDALFEIDTFQSAMDCLNREFDSTLVAVELRATLQQAQSPASHVSLRVDPLATDAAAVPASGSRQNSPSAAVLSADRMQTITSPFWTASTEMNIASYLSSRLLCGFEERTNCEGRLISLQPHAVNSKIWEKPHHFVSAQHVVKVYRILWDPTHKHQCGRPLAQALHESAATAFVCRKQHWHFDVFGVVNQGTHDAFYYLHICLLRTRLDPTVLGANDATTAGVQLLKRTGVVHGDCHEGNLKRRINDAVIELLDFERSFFLGTNDEAAMIESIKKYAEDARSRKQLLKAMQAKGMDDTRRRFMAFSRGLDNVFDVTMNAILHVFTDTSYSATQ